MFNKQNWTAVSKMCRKFYNNCQWCGVHWKEYYTGYLECHHLGTRGNGNNSEYRLCPMNLIVVCQDCHKLLEPFAKVRVQLTLVDSLGKEIKEVECCGNYLSCRRYTERYLKFD